MNKLSSTVGTCSPTLGLTLLVLLKTIDKSVKTRLTHDNIAINVLNLIMAFLLIITYSP